MKNRQLKQFNKHPYIEGGHSDGVHDIELTDLERQYADEAYREGLPFAVGEQVIYRPFRQSIAISQGFAKGKHPAYDWPILNGTKLHNVFPGKAQITFAGFTNDGYAYNLRFIYPEYKYMALFAHLQALDTWAGIEVGDWVDPIQLLCFSDNTGNSTGPHIHFEIRVPPYNRGYADCIDYWGLLMDLPLTPPAPPDPEEPPAPYILPTFPQLPEWELTTSQNLAIRQLPGAGSKLMGWLEPKKIVPVMGAQMVVQDLWLKIGHNEWIAAVYHMGGIENTWGHWLN